MKTDPKNKIKVNFYYIKSYQIWCLRRNKKDINYVNYKVNCKNVPKC